ncbi:AAEL005757-PA, partial [Aedes aegypti]
SCIVINDGKTAVYLYETVEVLSLDGAETQRSLWRSSKITHGPLDTTSPGGISQRGRKQSTVHATFQPIEHSVVASTVANSAALLIDDVTTALRPNQQMKLRKSIASHHQKIPRAKSKPSSYQQPMFRGIIISVSGLFSKTPRDPRGPPSWANVTYK